MTPYTDYLLMIQSITECFPISSSAHVLAASHFFKETDLSIFFQNTWLHLIPFFAFSVIFHKDVWLLLKTFFSGVKQGWSQNSSKEMVLLRSLIIITFPVVIACFVMEFFHIKIQDSLKLMAINSIIFGVVLIVSDRCQQQCEITEKKAFWIGLAQLLSLIPGVSRMGICLTMSRFLGISRYQSVRLACLAGMPILFCAGSYAFLKDFSQALNFFSAKAILFSLTGSFTALSILLFLSKRISFAFFGFYRMVFGITILICS